MPCVPGVTVNRRVKLRIPGVPGARWNWPDALWRKSSEPWTTDFEGRGYLPGSYRRRGTPAPPIEMIEGVWSYSALNNTPIS